MKYLAIPAIGGAFWCLVIGASPTPGGFWCIEAAVKGFLVWGGSVLVYLVHQWMHDEHQRNGVEG